MSDPQADLFRVLAQLNPAITQQLQQFQQPQPQFHPPDAPPPQSLQFPLQPPPQQQPLDPRLTAKPPPPARPDPRTIVTLPAANRYVSRYIASSAETLTALRALKRWQHAKESSWYAARQALIKRHKERSESDAKLASLLQSLTQAPTVKPPDSEKELRDYDRSVYEKQRLMQKEIFSEMNRLQIPLFYQTVNYGVDETTLNIWRRRLMDLLEDLCDDEVA
ncbi:hypothetical protein FPQ18DRAFT_320624 [Pyronema domesticum]|uniref:Similar to Uncharacterized protein C557.02c acc. no. Q9USS4 n=1 Tax=Pyronema omphalodes (strain CBS 100304) TaxID=1076935 RepID=U4KZD0_PYROM|nr:hypothetical protein FPQ18DRAFT_320624 [Pyronema domesticum]CCX07820.1 Similar to Uncharacterized protein C557.02c; acc. no. Q9USS4 [Pyronema omphalodes CBS 100304]